MKLLTCAFTGSHPEDYPLGVVRLGIELVPIQKEKGLDGCVPHALISVDERVIANERESQRRSLLRERSVEIFVRIGHPRLRDSALQCAEVPYSPGAPSLRGDSPVEVQDLGQGEIADCPRDHASRR